MSKNEIGSARIVRHVRYTDEKTGEYSARGGITFLFGLNYLNRTVDVSFAICSSKDNFCKADGIRYAEELGVERTMNLDEFQKYANLPSHRGFVNAYINILLANKCIDLNSEREDNLLQKALKQF